METIKITQVKSQIGSTKRQKKTLEALGLGRISKSRELQATPQILGMVKKVQHLIMVEES